MTNNTNNSRPHLKFNVQPMTQVSLKIPRAALPPLSFLSVGRLIRIKTTIFGSDNIRQNEFHVRLVRQHVNINLYP